MKKFEVNVIANKLQNAVSKVASVITNSGENKYLQMIEVEAANDNLTLTAHGEINGKMATIAEKIPADVQVEEIQKLFVPAKALAIFTKLFTGNGNINLQFDGENALKFGKYSAVANLTVDDAENVQKYLPKLENAKSFSVNCREFKKLIRKIITAAGKDTDKYASVFVEVEEDKISLTATDGSQIATIAGSIEGTAEKTKMLIPVDALKLVLKMSSVKALKVEYNENSVAFETEKTRIESNLFSKSLLESYPIGKIRDLIPHELKASAIVKTADLKTAIDNAAIIAQTSEDKTIKFSFKQNEGLIIESSESVGMAKIFCSAVASSDTTAAVNFDRLSRALSGITSEYVMIGKTGGNSLTIHDNDENFHYLISRNNVKKRLADYEQTILDLQSTLDNKDAAIATAQEKVSKAQKDLAAKDEEIKTAEETLKAYKKALRQAKNAVKKAEEKQLDAETREARQKAVEKAEKEVADTQEILKAKKAEYQQIVNWIDSLPVQQVYAKIEQTANSLNGVKARYEKVKARDEWLNTVAA